MSSSRPFIRALGLQSRQFLIGAKGSSTWLLKRKYHYSRRYVLAWSLLRWAELCTWVVLNLIRICIGTPICMVVAFYRLVVEPTPMCHSPWLSPSPISHCLSPWFYCFFIIAWFSCIRVVDIVQAWFVELYRPLNSSWSPRCQYSQFTFFGRLVWC